ncbi:MAG: SocA family protein [Maricaulaceae bacterium]|nr:SocA family protein [Maricaulaceae bacterium]
MHYVIWKCPNTNKLGSTKLNKILWFSEAKAYMLHGAPISGARFIRREHGPVAQQVMRARQDLISVGAIKVSRDRGFAGDRAKDRFEALTVPRLDALSQEERAIVDYWVKHICDDHTAESVSELSHDYGWEIAAMGEPLPYAALLAERIRRPSEGQLEWARTRARELSLP